MDTKPYDITGILLKYLSSNEEGMKALLTWFLNMVMQVEAGLQTGCDPYERSEGRRDYRNGYKPRSLTTRYGRIELAKPQLREGGFVTSVFEKYARVEQAVMGMIGESYIQGVSTRKMREVLSYFGIEDLSPSSVSRINKELDEKVKEFLQRPLEKMLYLYADATYFKVREGGRYVSKALLIVVGVREDGHREALGARVTSNEGEDFWKEFLSSLKERGVGDVKLIISDGHKGIKKAVQKCFTGASWQMCQVHFVRDVLSKVPLRQRKEVGSLIREQRESPGSMTFVAEELRRMKLYKAADTIENTMPDLFNYMAFPKAHWVKIRTTNLLERTNREIKRRTKVIGAFPNTESLLRLAVTILMNENEDWLTGQRYIDMETNPITKDTGNQITENN